MKGLLAALGIVLAAPYTQAVTLIKDGYFGVNPPANGCASGTNTLADWTVTTGNIDIESDVANCSQVAPPSGTYYLDLTGDGVGADTINQTVATTVGDVYSLTFWFGGNGAWQSGCSFAGYSNDGPV